MTLRDVTSPAAAAITATARIAIPPVRPNLDQLTSDVKLAFSADGRVLAAIAGNVAVTRWGVGEHGAMTRLATVTGDTIGSGAVAFAPGGQTVARPAH